MLTSCSFISNLFSSECTINIVIFYHEILYLANIFLFLLIAFFLFFLSGLTTTSGIIIVCSKAEYTTLLWATWLCLAGALLFFIGVGMTWKFPKLNIRWRSDPHLDSEVSNATPLSTMSREFNEPPPPYHVAVSQNPGVSTSQSTSRSYMEISKPIYIWLVNKEMRKNRKIPLPK